MGADELWVTVQAGDHYQATPRLKAALDELAEALQEADEFDTAGFADMDPLGGFSLFYPVRGRRGHSGNGGRGNQEVTVQYHPETEHPSV